jgi:AraC family transcriptional regulator of arabinose operon
MRQHSIWFAHGNEFRGTGEAREAAEIYSLGFRYAMRLGMIWRPHGTPDYLLMYFYEEALIEAGGELMTCPPGTVILWEPGVAHHYGHPAQPWTHSWIHCDGETIRRAARAHAHLLNRPFALRPEPMDRLLGAIHAEIDEHVHPDASILAHYFDIVLREIARAADPNYRPILPGDPIARVRRYLEENFGRPVTLAELCAITDLSRAHLSLRFREQFGDAPIRYLHRLRMRHAAHLLRDGRHNVSEVADAVGFQDALFFSRQFRKHYGVSPRDYRRSDRGPWSRPDA